MIDFTKATCATCLHWREHKNDGLHRGTCEYWVVGNDDGQFPHRGRHPITSSGFFCGEHPDRRAAYELAVEAAKERAQKEADRENRSNKESAKIPCPKCHGSGFTGRGSGYDDVCDCTGGYIGYVETQEKDG